MKLALYTAVYPSALRFVRDWLGGVAAQGDRDFSLCIALDGVTPEQMREAAGERAHELDHALALEPDRRLWLTAPHGSTIAQVRDATLGEIVQKYDAVALSDIDDVMLADRVAAARESLFNADLTACAMQVVDEQLRPTSARFSLPDDFCVTRTNVFGLTNTAWSCGLLARVLGAPADCALYDWRLATRAIGLGASWSFDHEPRTLYRQYGTSTAQVLPPFDAPGIERASRLVREHLREAMENWSAFCIPSSERCSPMFATLKARLASVEEFTNKTARDRDAMDGYLEALNALPPRHIWWSCVAHPQLESIWKRSPLRDTR